MKKYLLNLSLAIIAALSITSCSPDSDKLTADNDSNAIYYEGIAHPVAINKETDDVYVMIPYEKNGSQYTLVITTKWDDKLFKDMHRGTCYEHTVLKPLSTDRLLVAQIYVRVRGMAELTMGGLSIPTFVKLPQGSVSIERDASKAATLVSIPFKCGYGLTGEFEYRYTGHYQSVVNRDGNQICIDFSYINTQYGDWGSPVVHKYIEDSRPNKPSTQF